MIRQSRTVALTLDAVRAHRAALEEIGKRYGVRNIRVFGSVARGEAMVLRTVPNLAHQDTRTRVDRRWAYPIAPVVATTPDS